MKLIVLLATLSTAAPSFAAEHRTANVWWRGVQEFGAAKIENSMSAAVRQPGKAGEVTMPAIFLHPNNEGRATATFPLLHVGLAAGARVFFVGYVGLSDGIKWDDKQNIADGARFYVTVNGKDVLSAEAKESKWFPVAAELYEAPAGGGPFEGTVTLATDSGPKHNASYDWALFGEPMVVAVDGRPLPASAAVSGANGALIAQVSGGTGKVIVEGLNAQGQPVANAVTSADIPPGATGLRFISFDFGAVADCVAWRWRAEGVQVAAAWGGSLQPRLTLESCGPVQAVSVAGEPLRVRVAVRNHGPGALLPEHGATVECNGKRQLIERMPADSRTTVDFDLGIPDAGPVELKATETVGTQVQTWISQIGIWSSLPKLSTDRPSKARAANLGKDYFLLENRFCRWLIHSGTGRSGLGALVYVWMDGQWEAAGSVAPWLCTVADPTGGYSIPGLPLIKTEEVKGGVQLRAMGEPGPLECTVTAFLPDDGGAMKVEATVKATEATRLAAVWGPAVHAGDRATGAEKGVAIFPGLEYLEGKEASSSTRDFAPPLNERWTPHKFKITVPAMMVETRQGGPALAVVWDPNQKWDGEHGQPGATFASPDFINAQDNHLMQLILPSVPDFIPESHEKATEPVPLAAGQSWTLTQYIVAGKPTPDATGALSEWVAKLVGYPQPEASPRSFEDEMALCRHGYLHTVWDAEKQGLRHVVGWASANAPGHATLLLMDARAVAQGAARQEVLDRVKLIAEKTVKEQGAGGLASSAQCHIMGWEFPYHWGQVDGALAGMKPMAYGALDSQEDDGGWGYTPDAERVKLGASGTRVIGIVARNAYLMAKWVAITGDPVVEAGLKRALRNLDQYRVPRGAQGWECPILEPDVLASAYAVRAYVWAYMALGDDALIEKARYWARTGLAFQYAWDDGKHPGMRYASIPVFGSTFFTHTWIGLPVQWCGLVYAYGLVELMRFDPNDLWRKEVEGMTVSGMYQQWPMDNKELAGTYPDSFGQWFTHRNPVYINPEDIELNLLALKGRDPGLRSVRVPLGGGAVHVTAPGEVRATGSAATRAGDLHADITYLPNETFYATLGPVAVSGGAKLTANGADLPQRDSLPAGQTGWVYNAPMHVLSVGLQADAKGLARLAASGLSWSLPEVPKVKTSWDFAQDTEGWTAGHSCDVKAEAGHLTVTVTGDDPYAYSGPASIKGSVAKRLTVRARMTGGDNVALFWRSTRSPGWGPDKEVHVALPGDGQWHEITFDLSAHPLWTGQIEQIRLDLEGPGVAPGKTLEVDWIKAE